MYPSYTVWNQREPDEDNNVEPFTQPKKQIRSQK